VRYVKARETAEKICSGAYERDLVDFYLRGNTASA